VVSPEAVLAGLALGLSLAAPPGPVLALMARETTQRGPWAGAKVGLGATTADAGFLVLAALGAIAVLAERPTLMGVVSLLGALLLAWFARGAWRSARSPAAAPVGGEATFATGFLAAATSPFNLAWWVGPGSVLIASVGFDLVAGMFAGILGWLVLFTQGVHRLGQRIRRFQEGVAYASAVVLALFAAWVAWRGLALLGWA
jgi:threonine/homoserine/homoserine lactone efflux protein